MESGESLTHDEVHDLIGASSNGEVYQVRDTKLGRDVALKIWPWESSQNPETVSSLVLIQNWAKGQEVPDL